MRMILSLLLLLMVAFSTGFSPPPDIEVDGLVVMTTQDEITPVADINLYENYSFTNLGVDPYVIGDYDVGWQYVMESSRVNYFYNTDSNSYTTTQSNSFGILDAIYLPTNLAMLGRTDVGWNKSNSNLYEYPSTLLTVNAHIQWYGLARICCVSA